ncbi:hypothetical protein BDP27DRAFT_1153444, partial [Rhodocollybia butyracea]
RKISYKIISSPTLLLPKWREQLANTPFQGGILPCDVSTRWNSTYDMLGAFLEMRGPVTEFLDCSSNGMLEYVFEDKEWAVIEGLVSAFKDATLFFASNSSKVGSVIPTMDAIDKALDT